MLVFRGLTQAKEQPCAADLRKSLFSVTVRQILLDFAKASTTSKQIAVRSNIILAAEENLNNMQVAEKVKVSRKCVGKWRQRWHSSNVALVAIEANEWVCVMDNLNTHYGEPIVRAIAELLEIPESTLGDKKKRKGILGSEASRKAFLSDESHRIRFVFLPKHSSWLNQIEMIFGVINRRVMRNGSFTGLKDLENKLQQFIDYFNRTFARPISWKYNGTSKEKKNLERAKTWREHRTPQRATQILALVA
jgi:transposase